MAEALQLSSQCIKSLSKILLPPAELSSEAETYNPTLTEIQRERAQVEEICHGLEIALVTVPRFRYEEFMDHLEDALDFS